MKRSFLLPATIFLMFTSVKSQITIVSNDIAAIGYVAAQSVDENPSPSILEGGIGNINWDFSELQDGILDTFVFLDPSTTPYGDSFPMANLASRVDTSLHAYMVKDQDKIAIIGLGGNQSVFGVGIEGKLVISPGQSLIRFPATYLSAYQETVEQRGQVDGGSIGFPFFDSLRLVTTVERSVEIDAYGMMTIPSGTYNSLRSTETETSTYDVYALSSGVWQYQYSLDPDTIINYNWWTKDNGSAFPVVQMEYDPINQTRTVTWLRELTNTENIFNEGATLYPNPSPGLVTVELPEPFFGKAEFFDLNGKSVLEQKLVGEKYSQFDLSGYGNGMFILIMRYNNGAIAGYMKVNVFR